MEIGKQYLRRQTMKQTEIYYHKTKDGMIEIDDIKQAANHLDIKKAFGYDVEQRYANGAPKYLKSLNAEFPNIAIYMTHPHNRDFIIRKGDVLNLDDFQKILATMKAAGKRLKKIVDSQYETKMIRI